MAIQRYWYIDSKRLGIVEDGSITKETKTSNYVSPTEVNEIRIYAVATSTDFSTTTLGDSSEIPPQYHEALAHKAIAYGYRDPRNLQPELSEYFEGQYDKVLISAKKFARGKQQRGGYIKAYDF